MTTILWMEFVDENTVRLWYKEKEMTLTPEEAREILVEYIPDFIVDDFIDYMREAPDVPHSLSVSYSREDRRYHAEIGVMNYDDQNGWWCVGHVDEETGRARFLMVSFDFSGFPHAEGVVNLAVILYSGQKRGETWRMRRVRKIVWGEHGLEIL